MCVGLYSAAAALVFAVSVRRTGEHAVALYRGSMATPSDRSAMDPMEGEEEEKVRCYARAAVAPGRRVSHGAYHSSTASANSHTTSTMATT